MTATAPLGLFDELSFGGEWRRYQKAAIAAFERDRAAGRRRTHIVAPPGSGKTLVGVELVRRIGRRALVLTPNSAVQMQWPRAIRRFGSPADVSRTAGPEPAFPIACMTYQSLCRLDDPEVLIGRTLVARPLSDPEAGGPALLGRALLRRPPFPIRHHPVPADLARRKDRAEAFARAWSRRLGPTGLLFTQRSDEGRRARAEAAAEDGGYETLVRDVWV